LNIAVTGAAGFLGRYILSELVDQNHIEVTAVIRPGRTGKFKMNNVNLAFLDISQPPENLFGVIGNPDVLIHLAWDGLPNYRSLHHFESELPAQYLFLKMMVEQGLKTLVVPGTCFEYGMQSGPLSTDLETRPNNPYGFAKDTLRKQLQYLQSFHDFNLNWARLFYMYGEHQAETSLLPQLKKAVERGEKKFRMSGGEQLRDYLPVTEVARQITKIATQQKNIGVVNICSSKPQSVRVLVESWVKENNWDIELELGYYPYPDYEPMAFWGVQSINEDKITYES